jgi:hypothetical protein
MATKTGQTLGMTGSYNSNSFPQFVAIQSSIPFIQQAIDVLDLIPSSFPIIIADFGAAHGANSIYVMKIIIDYLNQTKKTDRSVLVIQNDLATNDWSSVFNLLNQDRTYFGIGNGRSFYEQCLPSNSLSIGYCANATHWLSRKPCNISNHCMSNFAQGEELSAFQAQAKNDYAQFLENRSRELTQGGVLILTILSADEQGRTMFEGAKHTLYKSAQLLPMNDEELLNYTIPIYIRSYKECLDEELFKKYSLQLVKSDFCLVSSKVYDKYISGAITLDEFAKDRTGYTRSYTESALKQALEINEKRSKEDIDELLNQFWSIYHQQVKERPEEHNSSSYRTHLVLKKL